jgi:hypothetical protein
MLKVGANGEPLDDEIAAVAHTDLVDRREEVIRRVAGDDVGEAGLDSHTDECEQAALPPRVTGFELGGPEADADLVVRVGGVWSRQVHGHVEVVAACFERGFEDGRVEARIAGVDDDVGLRRGRELDDVESSRGVDARAADAVGVCCRCCARRSRRIDVGNHDVLEGIAPGADCGEADPTPPAPTISTRMAARVVRRLARGVFRCRRLATERRRGARHPR